RGRVAGVGDELPRHVPKPLPELGRGLLPLGHVAGDVLPAVVDLAAVDLDGQGIEVGGGDGVGVPLLALARRDETDADGNRVLCVGAGVAQQPPTHLGPPHAEDGIVLNEGGWRVAPGVAGEGRVVVVVVGHGVSPGCGSGRRGTAAAAGAAAWGGSHANSVSVTAST